MKPKHKMGTLVQVRNEDGSIEYGTIDAVITLKDRFKYALEGKPIDAAVEDDKIVAAFRPAVARVTKPRATSGEPRKSKKKVKETEDAAA